MLNISVDLDGKSEVEFQELKDKLSFKNNTEVVRWAVSFANKRYQ